MGEQSEVENLLKQISNVVADKLAKQAFPAELEQEEAEDKSEDFFDRIVDDEDIGNDEEELLIQEREMLEEMP